MIAWRRLRHLWAALKRRLNAHIDRDERTRILVAKGLIADLHRRSAEIRSIREAEFSVFSQFGDDGILQFLIHRLAPLPPTFVEFGVQDYAESHTRFLLMHDNWRGLVMDGSQAHVDAIRDASYYWRHDLTARAAFITRENIDGLIAEVFRGEIGLLVVDIDGNDYHVWDAIRAVSPVIAVIEYNAVFGPRAPVTIPYDPAFQRTRAHHSNLYFGAGVAALCHLAEQKGYAFVGCNAHGNSAYFVRRDRLGTLPALTPEEGFVDARFRESRDAAGALTYLAGDARRAAIAHLPVLDVRTARIAPLAEH